MRRRKVLPAPALSGTLSRRRKRDADCTIA